MSDVTIKVAADVEGLKKAEAVAVKDYEVSLQNFAKAARRVGVALADLSKEIHLSMRVYRDQLRSLGLFHITAYSAGYMIVNKRGRNKLVPIGKRSRRF